MESEEKAFFLDLRSGERNNVSVTSSSLWSEVIYFSRYVTVGNLSSIFSHRNKILQSLVGPFLMVTDSMVLWM